jgi:site-specific recombinase XerD
MRAIKPLPSRRPASTFQRHEDSAIGEAVKVAELVDDYILRCEIRGFSPKTVQLYREDLSAFVRFCGENSAERLAAVGHQHVEGFMRAAQVRGCSAHTVHRLYRNLRAFFRDAARLYEGFVPPTEKVSPPRLPNLPPKALKLEQIQEVLNGYTVRARKGGRAAVSARRCHFSTPCPTFDLRFSRACPTFRGSFS